MKTHIIDTDSLATVLCGRSIFDIQLNPVLTINVPRTKIKHKKFPQLKGWCKTCKMIYNSSIVNCHPNKILK